MNQIYTDVRRALSLKARDGELSAKQILTAKKIIFQFNKRSVEDMVSLLGLHAGQRNPNQLIAIIKRKMRDPAVPASAKAAVKEAVYFRCYNDSRLIGTYTKIHFTGNFEP